MEPATVVETNQDPWQRAHRLESEVQQQLVSARGGPLSATKAAGRLGVSLAELAEQRRRGRVVALPADKGQYVYPSWQFRGQGVVAGLDAVLAEFDVDDPWERIAFLLGPNAYLDDETPLDELIRGRIEAVRRAARAYGEHGAP